MAASDMSCKEEMTSKDSLNRFCSDYLEEIFQFLPLKDCLNFECLNRRVQATIFKRVHVINTCHEDELWRGRHINLDKIESVLKKCRNVKSVHFPKYSIKPGQNGRCLEILQSHVKALNHLNLETHRILMSPEITEEQRRKFIRFYENTITHIDLNNYDENSCLSMFGRVKTICQLTLKGIDHVKKNPIAFLALNIYANDVHLFGNLCYSNFKSLTILKVELDGHGSHSTVKRLLLAIKDLKSLKSLTITKKTRIRFKPYMALNLPEYSIQMRDLAHSLPFLEKLNCNVSIDELSVKNMRATLHNINYFSGLKCLGLIVRFRVRLRYQHLRYPFWDLSGLHELTELIYLCLVFHPAYENTFCLPVETLKDMSTLFPKLVALHLNTPVCADRILLEEIGKIRQLKYCTLVVCHHTNDEKIEEIIECLNEMPKIINGHIIRDLNSFVPNSQDVNF